MYGKEESKRLRQDFWIAFGKSFPRKWVLYQTNIKGMAFKFHFDLHGAMVSLDVDHNDLEIRMALWNKLLSLKTLLITEYLPEAQFNDSYLLDNQKEISRIFMVKEGVSIHNKNTWQEGMIFLQETMRRFEAFFEDYREVLTP